MKKLLLPATLLALLPQLAFACATQLPFLEYFLNVSQSILLIAAVPSLITFLYTLIRYKAKGKVFAFKVVLVALGIIYILGLVVFLAPFFSEYFYPHVDMPPPAGDYVNPLC